MKGILILVAGMTLFSCKHKSELNTASAQTKHTNTTNVNDDLENFDWLIGNWKRLNQEGEKITYEHWKKVTPYNLKGHGFVMHGADTVWQERMVLVKDDSSWTLEVNTPENNDIIRFSMTEYNTASFVVKNEHHDFPKKISYWQNKELLSATVEGDSLKIRFDFEPIE